MRRTLANPLGLIHVETFRPLGPLSWTDYFEGETIPHRLDTGWPRCFACELTDDHAVIPAFAVTCDGIPVCIAHKRLGGMSFTFLKPACVVCGSPCVGGSRAWTFAANGWPPVAGYVCKAHRESGLKTPDSRATW